MKEISRILDQFQRMHNGDAWHGSPILAILDDISAKQAAQRPIPEAHTIWEILLHITAWEGEVARRLRIRDLQMPGDGDWNIVQDKSEGAWRSAIERFKNVHTELECEITTLDDSALSNILGSSRSREIGSGVSIYTLLHGIIQHTAYHAGQIALLKLAKM